MKNSKPTTARTSQQTAPAKPYELQASIRQSPAPISVRPEEIPSWMVEAPVQATEQPWWTQPQEETPWWVIQTGQGTPVGQQPR